MSVARTLLAIGDPNGIGPELAVRAAVEMPKRGLAAPVVVGDRFVVAYYANQIGMSVREAVGTATPMPNVIDLLPVDALPPGAFRPGRVSAEAGRATVAYIQMALKSVRRGFGSAIVAAPHSETAITSAGISFSGYPSLLSASSEEHRAVFLMLMLENLKITHATLHCSVSEALQLLNSKLVEDAARATHDTLTKLGIARPRIGVFGINPHAGENGLFGFEDARIVAPVVRKLSEEGLDIEGPTGCDVLLADSASYDGFVAMFHDQGHGPIKLLGGRNSSALCIGAEVIFSSVGHGAAFDIAGRWIADIRPTVTALELVSSINWRSSRLLEGHE